MELRGAAKSILRIRPIFPSTSQTPLTRPRATFLSHSSHRNLHQSSIQSISQSRLSNQQAAAQRKEDPDDNDEQPSIPPAKPKPSSNTNLADRFPRSKLPSGASSSASSSTNDGAKKPLPSSTDKQNNAHMRALLDRMEESLASQKPTPPSEKSDRDKLYMTPDWFSLTGLSGNSAFNPVKTNRHLDPAPSRLNANVGKMVTVNPGRNMELGRALSMMDMLIARNRVRATWRAQRFHERPGMKRKRLKRERWRRRFMDGFRGIARRVEELRRQGW